MAGERPSAGRVLPHRADAARFRPARDAARPAGDDLPRPPATSRDRPRPSDLSRDLPCPLLPLGPQRTVTDDPHGYTDAIDRLSRQTNVPMAYVPGGGAVFFAGRIAAAARTQVIPTAIDPRSRPRRQAQCTLATRRPRSRPGAGRSCSGSASVSSAAASRCRLHPAASPATRCPSHAGSAARGCRLDSGEGPAAWLQTAHQQSPPCGDSKDRRLPLRPSTLQAARAKGQVASGG